MSTCTTPSADCAGRGAPAAARTETRLPGLDTLRYSTDDHSAGRVAPPAARIETRPSLPSRLRDALPIRRPRWLRGAPIPDAVHSPTLTTERLVLRPHRLDDADAWHALTSDTEVIRYLAWPLRDRAESLRHLRDRTRHTLLERRDDFLALAVERDGELIGDVSLHLRETDPETRALEIGWVLHPAWQGCGYAREAADALLLLAFERMGARRVIARMDVRNETSRLLAERLGFSEVEVVDGSRLMALPAHVHRSRRAQVPVAAWHPA